MARNRNYMAELVSICLQTGWHGGKNIPVLLIGAPGTGKTSFARNIARKFSEKLGHPVPFSAFVLPQTMPEELSGVNVPNLERTAVNRLPLQRIKDLLDAKDGYSVVLFDELSSCSQQTGAATMSIASDNLAGDAVLSDRCGKIFNMNPVDQAAAGRELSPPESNRFCHLKWKVPPEDYFDYLRGGEGMFSHVRFLDSDWEQKYAAQVKSLFASFLATNPKLINQLESNEITVEQASGPWSSERSIENAARLTAACMSLGEGWGSELIQLAIDGCIGEGPGRAFRTWVRDMDLPNPETFFENPNQELPNHPVRLKVCLESIASAATNSGHPDFLNRWNIAWQVIEPVIRTKPDQAIAAADILRKVKPQGALIPKVAQELYRVRQRSGTSSISST